MTAYDFGKDNGVLLNDFPQLEVIQPPNTSLQKINPNIITTNYVTSAIRIKQALVSNSGKYIL
jgi:hypothetical protein